MSSTSLSSSPVEGDDRSQERSQRLEDNPNMDAEGAQPGVKNPKPWLQFPTPTFFKELNLPPRQEKPLPPSEGPEKRPLYLEHEWPEEAEWSSKVDKKLKEITASNCTRCPFTEAELKASPVEYTQDEARALEQSVPKQFDSEIIQDKDGHLLGVFLSDGLTWPWNTENGTTLAKIPLQATMDLVDAYPAPMPKTDDVRHVNPVDERKRLEQQGQPHGIYHTGLIRPKGHQLQQPQIDRESFPNMEKGEAVCRYYEAKAPIDQTLGMLLSRVHPRQYETNGNTYNHWAQRSMLRAFKCTERAQWPLNVTLVNARVGPHVDASDSPWSMVAMLASGEFTNGGNIICPQLGKQYVLREGGVLFMIARLLHHFVGSYEGQRISHVYAMHQCLYNVDAAVPASEMRMERKRKREAKEPTGELDASRGYVLCTFCQRPFDEEINLKRHLAKWRKAAPAEEDKNHKVDAVRAFAEREGWRPVVKERKRRKTEKSTGSQPSSRPVANVEASTSASSMTHQPHSNLEESMATSQPVAGLSSP